MHKTNQHHVNKKKKKEKLDFNHCGLKDQLILNLTKTQKNEAYIKIIHMRL